MLRLMRLGTFVFRAESDLVKLYAIKLIKKPTPSVSSLRQSRYNLKC